MQNNFEETAFPCTIGQTANDRLGMSLRDWFAGLAMQGMYANARYDDVTYEKVANIAYQQAQHMMFERDQASGDPVQIADDEHARIQHEIRMTDDKHYRDHYKQQQREEQIALNGIDE